MLRIGTNFPVPTLNPMTDGDNAWPIDELSLETLLKLGPDNHLEPDLATSVSQPNAVTYVYHLRRGVKFWDGDEMTAPDVVFSLDQYRAPSSEYATDFVGVNTLPLYKYSVAMARAELAQSAYPHGFSTTLYEYNYGSSVDISEVVAAELQKVGINAHVQLAATNPAWEAAMSGPDLKRPTDFATGYCGGPDISSCDARLGSWNTQQGEWNSADWAPPAVDNLLKQGLLVSNPAPRFAVYAKILRVIQTDVPYVGLFQEGVGIALSPKFTFSGYASEPDLTELDDYALNIKSTA